MYQIVRIRQMLSAQVAPERQPVHEAAAIMRQMALDPLGEPILIYRVLNRPEDLSEVRLLQVRQEIILTSHQCIQGSKHTRRSLIMIRTRLLSIRRDRIPI